MVRLAFLALAALLLVLPPRSVCAQGGDFFSTVIKGAMELEQQRRAQQQQQQEEQARRRALDLESVQTDRRNRFLKLEERRAEAEIYLQRTLDEQRAAVAKSAQQAAARLDVPAKQLVGEASEFIRSNPAHPRLLAILEQIEKLNSALREGTPTNIEESMKTLSSELQQESEYRKMLDRRAEKQREESARRLGDTLALSQQQRRFIVSYMTSNPSSAQLKNLLVLIKEIDENDKDKNDFLKMSALTEKVDLELRRLNLRDQFSESLSQTAQRKRTSGTEWIGCRQSNRKPECVCFRTA